MLSVTDIAADVAAGNTDAVEAAFQALVDWPNLDEIGPPSPDVLAYILGHVAEALQHDGQPMPPALRDVLARECLGTEAVAGDDYAAGSSFVLAHLDRWRVRYDQAMAIGQG